MNNSSGGGWVGTHSGFVTRWTYIASKEPLITINGTALTEGQAMTLRVAASHLASELRNDGLGNDEHGRNMTKLYLERLGEISVLMHLEVEGQAPK